MASPLSPHAAFDSLRRAHARFHAQALARLLPQVTGPSAGQVLAHEQQRGGAYLANANARLQSGFAAVVGEDAKQKIVARERRFLEQHLEAAAWRMRTAADLARLEEQGQKYGYWLMDFSKRTHCARCQRMQGRTWPIPVLREAFREVHPGCGCVALDPREAARRGLALTRGTVLPGQATYLREFNHMDVVEQRRPAAFTETALVEAVIHVPRFGSGAKWTEKLHPRGYHGKFAPVHHDLHPAFHKPMADIVDALSRGDADGVERGEETLHQHAADLLTNAGSDHAYDQAWEHTDHADRVLSRVLAASVNPEADRSGMQGVHELKGVTEPWGVGKRFLWSIPRGVVPERSVAELGHSAQFRVIPNGDEVVIHSEGELPKARAASRMLEAIYPALRHHRVENLSTTHDDDRPLDVGAGERPVERGKKDIDSIYAGVSARALGDAGENLVRAAAQRAHELGLTSEEAHQFPALREGVPLDWILGDLAVEVKTKPYRGLTPGTMLDSPSISGRQADEAGQRDRKIAELMALNAGRKRAGLPPMRAAQVQVYVNPDDDVGHMFMHVYPDGEEQYTSLRLPAIAFQRMVSEGIDPGDSFVARSGATRSGLPANDPSRRWVYLGAARLPINPLHADYQGRRVGPAVRRQRSEAAPRFADDGVPDDAAAKLAAPPPAPVPKAPPRPAVDIAARDKRIGELWDKGDPKTGAPLSQGEIGRIVGVKQPQVSKSLARLGIKTSGAGERRDIKPKEPREHAILRLAAEGRSVREIMRALKVNQTAVQLVLAKGEVAESGLSRSDSPAMADLRLVS